MKEYYLEIGLILSSLLFYADFDKSFDAVFSKGDGAALIEVDQYQPKITSDRSGKFGEAAAFFYGEKLETVWTKDVARYPARGNFPYVSGQSFDGAIGMWLQVDLKRLGERSLIWLDPVHLLAENDPDKGKIWMDLVMSELPDTPIFRFGTTVPKNLPKESADLRQNRVIIVPNLDFRKNHWHHIVGTWKNLNSTKEDGILHLYIDGIRVGEIKGFDHQLEWNIDDWEIRIGLGFRGKIDDFFILKDFITAETVAEIYHSGKSLGQLLGIKE